jgi:hypothetical protein
MRTYLAIVGQYSGYVLDVYPFERERNLKYYGDMVKGEFSSEVEATKAIHYLMRAKCETSNLEHWWVV